jgi:hypothetical protein
MKLTNNRNLQLIPILDLKGNPVIIKSLLFPLQEAKIFNIAYKFSTYPNANKGYDMVDDQKFTKMLKQLHV